MGGVFSQNIANIQQSFMNDITQNNQQSCQATVSNQANNNVVIVNGATVNGSFTGVTTNVSTDASCLMVSNMEDSVSNILSASLQQTNTTETDWFNGFSFDSNTNVFDITQSVTNNISQINQATCSANQVSSTSSNYIYLTNATIKGDFVGVSDTLTASASCSINNAMKNTTYNQAAAVANQTNTDKGMFVTMLGSFTGIIGLIIIVVIILFAVGAIGFVGYEATGAITSKSE